MNETFSHRYIVRPFYLLVRNWTIFLLFLIFLLISNIYSKYSNIDLNLSANFIYKKLPSTFFSLFANGTTVVVLFVCFLLMSYLIVGIGKDMLMIFTRTRRNLIDSMKHITLSQVIWFLKLEFYLYFLFGAIALMFYGLTFLIWNVTKSELIPVVILGGGFALLYPFFYIGLSLGSMFSVFPLSSKDKFRKISYFLPIKVLLPTYIFYAGRLFVEYIFIIGLPFISIHFFKNIYMANGFVILGLMLPLLVLRGSAYEFKLGILKKDADIQNIFHKHYNSE